MIELIHGNCLTELQNISRVGAVITDPVWPNCPPGLLAGCDNPAGLLQSALELIDARCVVIVLRYDSDPRFLTAVPSKWPFFRVQALPYAVPGYNGRKLGGHEFAYCFGEPVPSAPGRRVIPGVGPVANKTEHNGHPCPRSLTHMRWLVNWWTEPGETVLDPFAGSGTTLIAAEALGRNGIGIEIDAGYCEIARARMIKARLQPMFEDTCRANA